ncbi:hypothetical protein QBC47DRAFT_380084 [Echria macrotheca]|uniref:Uncharacterized protein n=1 Tax=Echria macrotheca TaxID=438768 RepID=A0AAJ0BG54_9PEZI|nr:hypothetical protein QBC47DRAFT_380084 [Echria macrotheca]
MEFPEFEPRCSCCYPPFWSDWDTIADFTPDPVGRLMEQKYIQSRAVQDGANPRGKYAPKPLPWSGTKLENIGWWCEDADEYRRHQWAKQRESGQGSTDTNPTQSKKKKKRTVNFPHILKAVDANIKRHRVFHCRCSYCKRDVILGRQRDARDSVRGAIEEGWANAASGNGFSRDKRPDVVADDTSNSGGGDKDGNEVDKQQLHPTSNHVDNDGDRERGPGFRLDDIIHPEPVFLIRYSSRRRAGRGPARQGWQTPSILQIVDDKWDWTMVDGDEDQELIFSDSDCWSSVIGGPDGWEMSDADGW